MIDAMMGGGSTPARLAQVLRETTTTPPKEKSVPDLYLHAGSAVQNLMAIGGVLV